MCKILNKFGWFKSDEVNGLKEEISILKKKLDERQEVINQTNAYWKKKLYKVKQYRKNDN